MRAFIASGVIGILSATGRLAAAQNIDGAFSLGIEVPVLDVRQTNSELSLSNPTTGASSTPTLSQTSTQMGLFAAGAGLDGKYGLSNSSLIGVRLSLRRETFKSGDDTMATRSHISLLPRFEYYFSPEDSLRPHLGAEAGYERSDSSGNSGILSNLWLLGVTGGLSYLPSPAWSFDVGGSLFLFTGSEDLLGQSASARGYGGTLRIGLSSWFGAAPMKQTMPSGSQRSERSDANTSTQDSPAIIRVDRGVVHTSVPVAPNLNLNLTTRPITNPEQLGFSLTMWGETNTFQGCESVAIEFAGKVVSATQVRRYANVTGFSATDSLVGTLPMQTLSVDGIHESTPEMVACDRRWPLESKTIGRLRAFRDKSISVALGRLPEASDTSGISVRNDTVYTELSLSRDTTLLLQAQPRVSPSVAARFIVHYSTGARSGCSAATITANGRTLELHDTEARANETSDGLVEAIEGQLPLISLVEMASTDDDGTVAVCGHRASVSTRNREQIWAFVVMSAGLSQRFGVWRGFQAPAAPPEAASTDTKSAQDIGRKK